MCLSDQKLLVQFLTTKSWTTIFKKDSGAGLFFCLFKYCCLVQTGVFYFIPTDVRHCFSQVSRGKKKLEKRSSICKYIHVAYVQVYKWCLTLCIVFKRGLSKCIPRYLSFTLTECIHVFTCMKNVSMYCSFRPGECLYVAKTLTLWFSQKL